MAPAIRFDHVSKRYLLGSKRAYIRYLLPSFLHPLVDKATVTPEQDLWALKDISLDIHPGEVLGLIGPNGAGKTTALSLLAGIISPTTGEISVRGRIGALIKLGAGFHPDLTGRENVYLNGSILGLRKDEIDHLYDDIVQFAELEPFMDTPVKRYSSGMYVRLGFAVAVHIDPEILLVDEILSVGDVSFQSRCLNRIGKIRESGATVIFVSHNMHHVASFCDRVVYLDHGIIKAEGDPGEVLARYTSDLMRKRADEVEPDGRDFSQVNGSGRLVIKDVDFLNSTGERVEVIQSGDPLTLRVHYETNDEIENPVLDVVMRDASRGNMFQATNRDFGIEFGRMGPSGFIDIHFRSIPSNNQVLDFFLAFWNSNHTEKFDWKRFLKLHVVGNPTTSGRFLFDCDWVKVVEDHAEVKPV
jgi:ABC-type polysaccharide/polyol phosphate transport system ATPase subunit